VPSPQDSTPHRPLIAAEAIGIDLIQIFAKYIVRADNYLPILNAIQKIYYYAGIKNSIWGQSRNIKI
jgi:hypothetical protein